MDSLFDGMVLFTPSQSFPDSDADQSNQQLQTPKPPIAASTDSVAVDGLSSCVSEPLDENLFSDLTLVTPESQSQTLDEPAVSSPATASGGNVESNPVVSRQVSRKKKRASSLKIGYGRSTIDAAAAAASVSLNSDRLHISEADDQSELDPVENSVRSENPTENLAQLLEKERIQLAALSEVAQTHSTKTAVQSLEKEQVQLAASAEAAQTNSTENPVQSLESGRAGSIGESISVETTVVSDIPSPLSPKGKFKAIKAEISLKLKDARELAASVSAAKKDAIRRRRKAADDLNLASLKHMELEKQLEVACEEEDFETADRVSNSLAEVEEQKANLLSILRKAELECDAIDSKMHAALEEQITAEEECVLLLKQYSAVSCQHVFIYLFKLSVECC